MSTLTIPTRTIVREGSKAGFLATSHLEEVRDRLAAIEERQDPVDHERTLNQLHVSFLDGAMTGQFLSPSGLDKSGVMHVSSTGAGQLSREVLPSRFFSGLKSLAGLGDHGEKIATMAWNEFSRRADNPRLVRTVRMRLPLDDANGQGHEVRRVIRSCHSQNYAPYSNLEFVQDILDNAGEYRDMPVLDWRVTDTGMRLRFASQAGGADLIRENPHDPIPLVEAWNSEVGMRRVVLRAGMWKLICTNGMGSWKESTEYNWIHKGNSSRIKEGVRDAFTNLLTTSNGVVDAYKNALHISVDNAFEWMEAQLRGQKMPDRVIIGAQKALTHPTTTPGGRLASVIDAITLVAQDEADIFDQYEVERSAARILAAGRGIALSNSGRIPYLAA